MMNLTIDRDDRFRAHRVNVGTGMYHLFLRLMTCRSVQSSSPLCHSFIGPFLLHQ